MPEQPPPKRPSAWTLSKAHGAGQLVRVRCGHCNITRHYQPADLQQLAGDVPADGIRMRCEKCGKSEWMRATFEALPAAERQAIRVRRLAEVRMVRKAIWRDEAE
jgi:ribosomal protein S27AE